VPGAFSCTTHRTTMMSQSRVVVFVALGVLIQKCLTERDHFRQVVNFKSLVGRAELKLEPLNTRPRLLT